MIELFLVWWVVTGLFSGIIWKTIYASVFKTENVLTCILLGPLFTYVLVIYLLTLNTQATKNNFLALILTLLFVLTIPITQLETYLSNKIENGLKFTKGFFNG